MARELSAEELRRLWDGVLVGDAVTYRGCDGIVAKKHADELTLTIEVNAFPSGDQGDGDDWEEELNYAEVIEVRLTDEGLVL